VNMIREKMPLKADTISKLITKGRSQVNTMHTRLSRHNNTPVRIRVNKTKVAWKTLAYENVLIVLRLSGLSLFSEYRPAQTSAVLCPLKGNQQTTTRYFLSDPTRRFELCCQQDITILYSPARNCISVFSHQTSCPLSIVHCPL